METGDEGQLAGEQLLASLEPEGREMVEQWVRELAQQEEHRLWKEIVRFTRKAAHVAQLLLDDYERQLQARI